MSKQKLDSDIILAFSYYYVHSQFDDPKPHPQLHLELWDLFCSPHKRVAIAAPRGHAKTSAGTFVYALAALCFREVDFVVIVTTSEDASKLFLAELNKQFAYNEKLRKDFKVVQDKTFELNTTTDFIVNFEDGHQCRVMGRGALQPIRGAKWDHKRPNLILGDDLEDPKEVMNPKLREELRRKIRNDYEQAMSTYGKIRIVGTILHSDSLLERLMPENQTKDKSLIVREPLRTWSKDAKAVWKSVRYRAHPSMNDFSHILWPEQFSPQDLQEKLAAFLQDNDAEGYAQEFLNEPVDTTRAFFATEGFQPMREEDWELEKTWYCGADLAVSTANTANYSAFVVGGATKFSELCIVEVVRKHMDTLEIVDTMFELHKIYPGLVFILEKGPILRALQPVIEKTMLERNRFFEIMEVPSVNDKLIRARPLQHRFKAKALRFDDEAPWYDALVLELKQFPRGKNDDQVDALANIPLKLQYLLEGEEQRDPVEEDEEFEEDLDEVSFFGRSITTGY